MDLGSGHLLAAAIGAAVVGVINAMATWRASRHDTDRADRDQLRKEFDALNAGWGALREKVEADLQTCRNERDAIDDELATVRSAARDLADEVKGLRRDVKRLKASLALYEARHGGLPPEELAAILSVLEDHPSGSDIAERGEPST